MKNKSSVYSLLTRKKNTIILFSTFKLNHIQGRIQNFKLVEAEYKEKKIHIVLKNYKFTKLLFLNTLKYNHIPIKTKTK